MSTLQQPSDGMDVLVTGFRPFGGRARNTSGDLVQLLPAVRPGTVVEILDVHRLAAPRRLLHLVRELRPRALLMLGEARGTSGLRLERVAHNTYRDEHEAGVLDPAGPHRMSSSLSLPALATAVRAVDVEVGHSDDAGTYVCNALYYATLQHTDLPSCFVHVPALEDDADLPALLRGVVAMLDAMREAPPTAGAQSRRAS